MSNERGLEVKKKDLYRTQRIDDHNRKSGRPRVIIVKFTRYGVRSKVYSNKKKRKRKNLLITERLISRRYKLLREA